jgi:hypothetical protein
LSGDHPAPQERLLTKKHWALPILVWVDDFMMLVTGTTIKEGCCCSRAKAAVYTRQGVQGRACKAGRAQQLSACRQTAMAAPTG